MALIVNFSISLPPVVDILGNDGLPAAIIDVDMAHDLFPAAPHPGHGPARVGAKPG